MITPILENIINVGTACCVIYTVQPWANYIDTGLATLEIEPMFNFRTQCILNN